MLYTSGTTGRPKGVFRRTRPVVSQLTDVCNETAKWNPATDISLLTGPLYHAAPLGINFVIPINAGVGVLLMDKWDAEETLRLIETHKATHTHIVPTMMHRMLQLPEATRNKYDVSSMRWIIHGAAPCPAHVKKAMMDWFGPVIYEYYSSTEGGGVFVGPHEWLKKPGTVGKAVPGVEIKLLDIEGNPVPQGTEGLIYVKAPGDGPVRVLQGTGQDGFKLSRRLVHARRHGPLRCRWRPVPHRPHGRADHLWRREHLSGRDRRSSDPPSADIADAAVVGVPNEDWGEEIKAVVELKPGVDALRRDDAVDPGFREGTPARLPAAAHDRLCRHAAAQRGRQGASRPGSRAVLGGTLQEHLTTQVSA